MLVILNQEQHADELAKVHNATTPLRDRGNEYTIGYLESFIATHGLADRLVESVDASQAYAEEQDQAGLHQHHDIEGHH